MARDRHRLSRLFLRYLFSYAVIISIPLIILTVFIYRNTIVALRNNTNNGAIAAVTSLMDMTESMMDEYHAIVTRVSYDHKLTPYNLRTPSYTQIEAVDQLGVYRASNDKVYEIAVILKGEDKVYTSQGVFSEDVFFKSVFNGNPNAVEEMNGLLDKNARGVLLGFYEEASYNKMPLMAAVYAIPLNSDSVYGSVVILGYRDVIGRAMENLMQAYRSNTYITDSSGRLLFGYETDETSTYEDFADTIGRLDSDGVNDISVNGTRYTAVFRRSQTSGYRYVTLIPNRLFYSQYMRMQYLIIGMVAGIVAICLALAWILAYRQVKPINEIGRFLGNLSIAQPGRGQTGEIESIYTATQMIVNRNKILLNQLDRQRPMVRRQILHSIIVHDMDDWDELKSLADWADIRLDGSCFCVMAIQDGDETESIVSIINRFFEREHIGYGIEMMNASTVIMIVNLGSGDTRDRQREIADKLRRTVREVLNVESSVGIGRSYNDLTDMHTSMVEAVTALEYAVNIKEHIVSIDDITKDGHLTLWYPDEEMLLIGNAIKQSNELVVGSAVAQLRSRIHSRQMDADMLRCVCYFIINRMLRVIDELGLADKIDTGDLIRYKNVDHLLLKVEAVAGEARRCIEDTIPEFKLSIFKQIIDYIDKNYTNPDMSINAVVERFGMTPTQFSRFFKARAGVGFNAYISGKRIQKAKILLQKTDMVIRDIVSEVGYTNLTSFTKKFHTETGVSPGKYREIVRSISEMEQSEDGDARK